MKRPRGSRHGKAGEGDGSPALSLREVEKRYPGGEVPAVRPTSLELRPGERLAVVGESGCGKTTLLRLVAGLEVPDRGVVRIAGRTVAGPGAWVPPDRRGVGMVFQEFALFPHLRVEENVAFGLASLPRSERRARVRRMLEMVGLEGLGARYPHQLSGGQQQRGALARSLAPEPHLLLLDEPFSNLDPALKVELRDELDRLLEGVGVSVVLVVHDADDVFSLADRVAVMRDGRILQLGAPSDAYRRPVDEYVARFFGEANVLPGRPCPGGVATALCVLAGCDAAGGRCRVVVRPEHVRVERGVERGVAARVARVRPAGRQRRLALVLEEGAPGLTVSALVSASTAAEPGDVVYVSVDPADAHLLE